MTDVTISLRVDKQLHEQMKLHDEINWSAVLRKSITQHIERVEYIDLSRAQDASKQIAKIRKSRVFDKGKKSEDIIREWREKRK